MSLASVKRTDLSVPRRMILHIGGPKCGSSALQAALSANPRLKSKQGSVLNYVGLRGSVKWRGWSTVEGRQLSSAAARSKHGYISWPNLGHAEDPSQVFTALDGVWKTLREGRVPVLSNEGWVGQSEAFQSHLPHWFDVKPDTPVIDVQAYARPPLDWLNSAYWQWGVWSGRNFQGWLDNMAMPYRLGAQFAQWNAMSNVRLRLHLAGDVLAHFSADHGVDLKPAPSRNTSLPPAMVGFLLRNRRFRPTPHDSGTEFVFQRWCEVKDAPKLWALMPRHVQMVRQALRSDVETLFGLLSDDDRRAVRQTDRRWTSNEPYHDVIRRGRSKLDVPEEQAGLYHVLCIGVEAAAKSARKAPPQLGPPLAVSAGVAAWDALIATALDQLIALDQMTRRRGWVARALTSRASDRGQG